MKIKVALIAVFSFLFVFSGALAYAAAKDVAKEDKKFVHQAGSGGLMEVKLGQLAEQKAQSKDVKNLGIHMATDHGMVNDELKALAEKKDIKFPAEMKPEEKKIDEKLAKLSGPDFDKKYMHEIVKDHAKTLALFRDAEHTVKDTDLSAFAKKTIPTLEAHLTHAKDVASKVGVDVDKAVKEGERAAKKEEK